MQLGREDGSVLFEFALVAILLLTLLFGAMGFGHALYAYHFVNHAAREAARWAAVNGSTCNADAAYSSNGNGSCTAPVTCSGGSCSLCTSGCSPAQEVDVQNYVKMITPLGIDINNVATTASCGVQKGKNCADSVPASCSTTVNRIGCTVQVTVTYAHTFIFPLVHNNPITLSSTSEMVIAH